MPDKSGNLSGGTRWRQLSPHHHHLENGDNRNTRKSQLSLHHCTLTWSSKSDTAFLRSLVRSSRRRFSCFRLRSRCWSSAASRRRSDIILSLSALLASNEYNLAGMTQPRGRRDEKSGFERVELVKRAERIERPMVDAGSIT